MDGVGKAIDGLGDAIDGVGMVIDGLGDAIDQSARVSDAADRSGHTSMVRLILYYDALRHMTGYVIVGT